MMEIGHMFAKGFKALCNKKNKNLLLRENKKKYFSAETLVRH
jgi:hypothetical protein